jgi:hypothetical protein
MTPRIRIGELLKPPPPSQPPTQILEWVIRVTVVTSIASTIVTLVLWATSAPAGIKWAMTIATLLGVSSVPSLRRAKREAERRGPQDSPAEVAHRRERGKRALWGMLGAYMVGFPIIGFIVEGSSGALFFLVAALATACVALLWNRHYLRE